MSNFEILGARLCPHCDSPKVEVGGRDKSGEILSIEIPTALRHVIGEEAEFFVLGCGHRLHKLMPYVSAQEWMRGDQPEDAGHLPVAV